MKKNQIEFFVPNVLKKIVVEQIKAEGVLPGIKIKRITKQRGQTLIVLQDEKDFDPDSINIGMRLQEIRVKAAAEFQIQETKKKDKQGIDPIMLHFPDEIAKDFKNQYKEELNIVKYVSLSDSKGGGVNIFFDVNHIKGRTELVKQVAKIFDAYTTAKENLQEVSDLRVIKKSISQLNEACPYIEEKQISFKKMMGSEIIEKGYAVPYLDNSKMPGLFKQLIKLVVHRKQFNPELQYYYMNKPILPNNEYVVKLRKPEIKTAPFSKVNHEEQILLRYEFGEFISKGQGIVQVKNYFQTMANIHNEQFEKNQKGGASSKTG